VALAPGMFSSEYDSWCTPAPVLDRVREIGPIGLDPFSNAQSIVSAKREFRLERGEDALRLDWRGFGLVYVNPPFGDEIVACMRRVAHFGLLGVEIVALIPHRTDTGWYREAIMSVTAKCEWRGRMKFIHGASDRRQMNLLGEPAPLPPTEGDAAAPFPTALLYYGRRRARFVRAFAGAGEIWTR
jgi:hypothetical protein